MDIISSRFRSTRSRYIFVLLLLFVSSLAIYSNILRQGQFLFDDADYILNNPIIQQLESFTNFTDPRYIGYLSFFLNFSLGGMDHYGFHLFIIHCLNGYLIFLLTTLIISIADRDGASETPTNWQFLLPVMVSLLFVCHPLATQSVSYITQRFTSLSAFFYLLAVVLYLSARQRFERIPEGNAAYRPYLLSLAATVLAMKTKEIAFTIPFTLFFLELILFEKSFFRWRRLVFLTPYLLTLLIVPLSIYGPVWGLLPPGTPGAAEITRLDKIYDLEQRSRYEYFISQSRAVMIYLRLMIFPYNQKVIYDFAASRTIWSVPVILSFLGIALLHIHAFLCWLAASFGSGRKALERRLIAIGIFWFFITISIESSLLPIKDLIFEHRTYLPGFGILLVASVYLLRLAEQVKPAASFCTKAVALISILTAVLGAATYSRNRVWTNDLLFWQDAVEKTPNKPIAYHNRGLAYSKLGYIDEAIKDLDITISYFEKNQNPGIMWETADLSRFNMSKAYVNRANMHQAMGHILEAEADEHQNLLLMLV
jgi:tetratricopeptide (TPR) repeat protein